MKRLRWCSLTPVSPSSLRRLVDGMRKEEFADDRTSGFLIERSRTNFVEARFIERLEQRDAIVDPFGEIHEFTRVEFQQTRFRIGVDAPQLEFSDYPRSLAPAINSITAILGIGSVVRPLEVDVAKWISTLAKSISEARVTAASIAQVSLSDTVSAKVLLKGSDDVRGFVKDVVGNRDYRFARLDVSAVFDGLRVRFELRDDGSAALSAANDKLEELLRLTLLKAL